MRSAALSAFLIVAAGAAFAGDARTGAFEGASDHIVSGAVSVEKTDAGYEIRFGEDFTFDGAPDPRVGFGNDGTYAEGTDFEPLKAESGEQVYTVPDSLDPAEYDTVMIWCRQFSVPLAVATLN